MAAPLLVIDRRSVTLLLILVTMATIITASAGGSESPDLKEVEIRRQLKQLNKPAVKSITSPDGDVIDCVPIANQLAFDHPLLKNHTIQKRPSFHPEGVFTGKTKKTPKAMIQLWHTNGKCPENTIPVRRTKKEDLLRPTSLANFGTKSNQSIPQSRSTYPYTGHEHAITYVKNDKFYGSKSTLNLWTPFISTPYEFSLAQTWVLAGNAYDLNSVEAGWQVFPRLYGDSNTRFFVYWTRDAYRTTGCYNLLCSGFVQTSNEIALGGSLSPTSTHGGSQYEITILIWKDTAQGVWWLQVNGNTVGYWPGSLFTLLSDSGTMVEWGGEVYNIEPNGRHTSTVMGSGYFAEEGFGKASYMRNLMIVDGSNNLRDPQGLQPLAEKPNCYNVQIGPAATNWKNHFYFGGSGLSARCP